MICLNETMRAYGRTINIFIATETVTDELEGTVSLVYQNPIPVEGMLEGLAEAIDYIENVLQKVIQKYSFKISS